tara:strand:- start:1921 stop:2520 length:600 start_codon:yes stop_codon:yes gene_type:complete
MIGIVDYGMGNVGSVESMINHLGYHKTKIVTTPEELKEVDKIILPGVGTFDNGMKNLKDSGLFDELNTQALINNKPVLGICLGMQLLMDKSEEGKLGGLGWIKGECKKFRFSDNSLKVPHMGWNVASPITNELCDNDSRFYFVHSYYVKCIEKDNIMLKTNYGMEFVSGVSKDSIFGVQFHPEKSHKYGMELMEKFINL